MDVPTEPDIRAGAKVASMITSTALSAGYAVAQSISNSNMSSSSVTNATSSSVVSSYKFERGYPAAGTAVRAYDDADLGRAIEVYKFFYPTVSTEGLMQATPASDKPNQVGIKMATGPLEQS